MGHKGLVMDISGVGWGGEGGPPQGLAVLTKEETLDRTAEVGWSTLEGREGARCGFCYVWGRCDIHACCQDCGDEKEKLMMWEGAKRAVAGVSS